MAILFNTGVSQIPPNSFMSYWAGRDSKALTEPSGIPRGVLEVTSETSLLFLTFGAVDSGHSSSVCAFDHTATRGHRISSSVLPIVGSQYILAQSVKEVFSQSGPICPVVRT